MNSINSYLVGDPQVTYMKSIYRQYTDFINIKIPVKITNINSSTVHFEISNIITKLGANYIYNIAISKNKFPLKSITLYSYNNYEVYHSDLLNFIMFLQSNNFDYITDNFMIIPYNDTVVPDKKLYIQFDFKNKYPDEIDLYLDLCRVALSDIPSIEKYNPIPLYNKNYFEHHINNIGTNTYSKTLEPHFNGKIFQIMILLKSQCNDLEFRASLIIENRVVFKTDPHINKILLLNNYNVKQYDPKYYVISFNNEPDPQVQNKNFITIMDTDKINIIIENRKGPIGSAKIKIWGVCY